MVLSLGGCRSLVFLFLCLVSCCGQEEESQQYVRHRRLGKRKRPVVAKLNESRLLGLNEPRDNITPLFWHIHKAGGTTLQDMASYCLDLVVASEVGVLRGHGEDDTLRVFSMDGTGSRQFVNVDTTSYEGIARAKQLGFDKQLRLADVVFTGLLTTVLDKLYSSQHKAVLFTILRHPVDRAVSTFHYLKHAHWEFSYQPTWANMTLMQFAELPNIENNWVVRFLVDKPQLNNQALDEQDLEQAKRILREKVWVGLVSHMDESIQRFGQVFGWNRPPKGKNWNLCMEWLHEKGGSNRNTHKHYRPLDPSRAEWQLLARINHWDMKLYEYAEYLFQQQGTHHFSSTSTSINV